ncbi:hypothetical protein [Streptosporangium sp. NPDC000396]|uniref:hypothetical protein n=1 Tax=Streptosporangium sp. NPDC000396 TaxID=3366185 RepID=UPI003697A550
MNARIPLVWGATDEELRAEYACDQYLPATSAPLFRAVTVEADRAVLFRWMCQLKVSSYSFAFLFGMPTPRQLTPGTDHLERGQRFMDLFDLVDFEDGHHLTLAVSGKGGEAVYGRLAVSYVARDLGDGRSRLVVKTIHEPVNGFQRFLKPFLAWGDLLMMRRQFHNLKRLAEREQGLIPRER